MAAGSSHSRSRTGRAILKDFDSSKAVRIQLSSSKGFASADIRRRRARPGQPIQFFARDSRNLSAKQRGDQVFCGPLKKSFHQVAKSGPPRDVTRHRWDIHIPQSMFFVPHVPFFFKDPELRAHRRITGLIRQLTEDLRDGGPLEFIENVHDLAFAARQSMRFRFLPQRMLVLQQMC